jgi:hypothetical protein
MQMLHGVVRDKIDQIVYANVTWRCSREEIDCHHRFIKRFMQILHGGVRDKIDQIVYANVTWCCSREDSLSSSLIYQIVYVNVTWCILYLKLIQAKDERASLYGCEKGTEQLNIAVLVESILLFRSTAAQQ